MPVEREAELLLSLIETILEDGERGAVDKAEQIYGLLASPSAAWLGGRTAREVFVERPYYVLFVSRPDEPGCYENVMGSPDLADAEAAAHEAISRGARFVYITQVIETPDPSNS